jgi:predicted lipoprotein
MTMTDAELIEILRSSANRVVNYAGDRIEQLERELSISRMAQVVMDNTVEAAEAEWRKYEAAWMTAEGKLADAEAENDRAWAALWDILACETPNANATVTRMVAIAKSALKGESHE